MDSPEYYARRPGTLTGVFVSLLALDLLLQWTNTAAGLAALLSIALIGVGAVLCFRLIRQSIWRLRNRLIVTYVFMALVPIALIIALAGIGTWIVAGQVAVYLVHSELDRRAAALENPARFLSRATPAERSPLLERIEPLMAVSSPDTKFCCPVIRHSVTRPTVSCSRRPRDLVTTPGMWKRTAVIIATRRRRTGRIAQSLWRRSLSISRRTAAGNRPAELRGDSGLNRRYIAGGVPPAYNVFDRAIAWAGRMTLPVWEKPEDKSTVLLVVQTRPSAVLATVFGNQAEDGQTVLVIFAVVASLLLVVELTSLFIGVSLSRTITSAVHQPL